MGPSVERGGWCRPSRYSRVMAKVARPAQGNNTNRKIVKKAAGGTNERVIKTPRNTNNTKRGYAS